MSKQWRPAYTEDKIIGAIDKLRRTNWWKKKHLKD